MWVLDTRDEIPLSQYIKYATSCSGVFAISIQSGLFTVPTRVKYSSRFIFYLILVISMLLFISIPYNITFILNWFNYEAFKQPLLIISVVPSFKV